MEKDNEWKIHRERRRRKKEDFVRFVPPKKKKNIFLDFKLKMLFLRALERSTGLAQAQTHSPKSNPQRKKNKNQARDGRDAAQGSEVIYGRIHTRW